MTDETYFEDIHPDETDREIESHLKTLLLQKKNSKSNITNLLILVAVLFIHELGHFIGIRLFKYR